MAVSEEYPYTFGSVAVDGQSLVFRRSPGRFFRSQLARLRQPTLFEKLTAVVTVVGFLLLPVISVQSFYLAVLSDAWYARGPVETVYFLASGLLGTVVLWDMGFHDRRLPFDRLDGITTSGKRSIRLSVGSYDRIRTLGVQGVDPSFTMVRTGDRERLVTHLAAAGFSVERGRGDTDARYRFFRSGGGYVCPECDTEVSVRDASCAACGRGLRPAGRQHREARVG